MKRLLVTFAMCAAAACADSEQAPPSSTQPATPQAATAPIPAPPAIDGNAILERIKVLSSDEYEGRAPGTRGEDLTVKYLVDESKKLGLQPGNPDGTYVQKVPLVGITGAQAQPLTITKGAQKKTYKWS
ncbi:MAG TPA: hypothetical protein VM493_06645, partial [Vicinamibacterales bacterium]|nr:hypothetical protein [Vicinamibacterales bacterium]